MLKLAKLPVMRCLDENGIWRFCNAWWLFKCKWTVFTRSRSILYGEVKDVRGQRALITIYAKKGTKRELALPYLAAIHISQVTPGYIDKLTDAFRIGDLIEAKVVKIMGDNLDLNTEDITSGVVKAMCTRCRTFMDPCNESEVYCPVCDRKEKRKVSKNYDY